MKATPPRREILRLMTGKCKPMSAHELHKDLPKNVCDLVTVYRTVESFEKAGILRRCDFSDGIVRHEIVPLGRHHHHHLVCTSCKKVEPVEVEKCPMATFEKAAKLAGYIGIRHSLEVFGTCPSCQKS